MSLHKSLNVICKRINFFSPLDEKVFFYYLSKIKSIVSYEGVRDEIILYFKQAKISDDELGDLVSLFRRYNIDLQKLEKFVTPENRKVFTYYLEHFSINVYPVK